MRSIAKSNGDLDNGPGGSGSGNPGRGDEGGDNPPTSGELGAGMFKGEIDASDLANYPKADCIYQKLAQTGTMKSVISKFAGEQTNCNLDITVAPLSNDDGPVLGRTESHFSDPLPITIVINSNTLDRIPNLVLALIFLHEGIHAEMGRKVKSINGYENLDKSNFPGLYDFWHRYAGNYQHEEMAAFYESLAYHGLKGTVTWKGLSENRQKKADDNFDKIFQTGSYQCN